jgi:hypothetical protein
MADCCVGVANERFRLGRRYRAEGPAKGSGPRSAMDFDAQRAAASARTIIPEDPARGLDRRPPPRLHYGRSDQEIGPHHCRRRPCRRHRSSSCGRRMVWAPRVDGFERETGVGVVFVGATDPVYQENCTLTLFPHDGLIYLSAYPKAPRWGPRSRAPPFRRYGRSLRGA